MKNVSIQKFQVGKYAGTSDHKELFLTIKEI